MTTPRHDFDLPRNLSLLPFGRRTKSRGSRRFVCLFVDRDDDARSGKWMGRDRNIGEKIFHSKIIKYRVYGREVNGHCSVVSRFFFQPSVYLTRFKRLFKSLAGFAAGRLECSNKLRLFHPPNPVLIINRLNSSF